MQERASGKKNYDTYHEKNWGPYESVLSENGFKIAKKHVVGKEGWTAIDDWREGDCIVEDLRPEGSNKKMLVDLKSIGRFGAPVKRTQVTNPGCKVQFFDFFDVRRNDTDRVCRVKKRDLYRLYREKKWCQRVIKEKNVNDPKNGLIRFNTEDVEDVAQIFIGS